MKSLIIALIIIILLALGGAYAWTKMGLKERVTGSVTDTQPLGRNPSGSVIPFPSSSPVPDNSKITLASGSPLATSTPTPIQACQYLGVSATTGNTPFTAKFTVQGTAVGANRSYIFDFGEGQTITQKETVVSHTYQKAGNYTAKLQVVDKDGKIIIGDCSKTITATTKVEVKVSPTPVTSSLPKTGPESFLLLLIAPISGLGMWLYKRFKLI